MKHCCASLDRLSSWAHLNSVQLHGSNISSHIIDEDGNDRGGGLIATTRLESGKVILNVPSDLVLSKEQVEQHAKTNKHLKEVLEAVGPAFSQVGSR